MLSFTIHKNIKNVLVVEDNTVTAILLESKLRQFDLIVQKALDGQEAWDYIQNNKYDLLLIDLNIPLIHGKDLIQKIRTLDSYKNTTAIAVSAGMSDAEKKELKKMGYSGCMNKPIGFDKTAEAYIIHGEN